MSVAMSPLTPDPTNNYPSFANSDIKHLVIDVPTVRQDKKIDGVVAVALTATVNICCATIMAVPVVFICHDNDSKFCRKIGDIAFYIFSICYTITMVATALFVCCYNRKTEASPPS